MEVQGPCGVCGKPSGPCIIKPREKSFFCIHLTEHFEDHAIIPCYICEQFNNWTSNIVSLLDKEWFMYTVQVQVTPNVTFLNGKKWQEFVTDHGLALGDTLTIKFPKNKDESIFITDCIDSKGHRKERLDKTDSNAAFNADVDYKLAYVCYTKGISLSDVEKENLLKHIEISGFGASGYFVHRITNTNKKEGLKFLKAITSALRPQIRGEMIVYVSKPECESTFQYRVDTDGRMATTGCTLWTEFVAKAKFKTNELVSFIIYKESARIVVSGQKL